MDTSLPVIYIDELGLALYKEAGVPALATSLTRLLKDSLLTKIAFANEDAAAQAAQLLGKTMRDHFQWSEPVWDIYVSLSLLNHKRVFSAVAEALAGGQSTTELAKDEVRNQLASFVKECLMVRHKLEHGFALPIIALCSAVDSMLGGLKLLGGTDGNDSLQELATELKRLAALSDLPGDDGHQQQVSAALFGSILLRRAFSEFVEVHKGRITDCRRGTPDAKHLSCTGCDCSRRVWRHHLADGSAKREDLPQLLKGCPECTAMMAACHDAASVCAHLKSCKSGCGSGLSRDNLATIEKARHAWAHGSSTSLIETYEALVHLEKTVSQPSSEKNARTLTSEQFRNLVLENERTRALDEMFQQARQGSCAEAAGLADVTLLFKHMVQKKVQCPACAAQFPYVNLKALAQVGSTDRANLGRDLSTLLTAVGRSFVGSPVDVSLKSRSPGGHSTAVQLPLPRLRSAFPMVGREEDLLVTKDRLARESRVGLHGRSGVGKSLLAREVVVSFEREAGSGTSTSPFKYFRAIQASSRASLVRDWLSFARALSAFGVLAYYPDDSTLTDEQALKKVRDPVAAFLSADEASNAHEFLLLIDDVASEEVATLLNELLTEAGGEPRCGLLFTAVTKEPLIQLSAELVEVHTLPLEYCMSIVADVNDGYRNLADLRRFIEEELVCHTLTVCVIAKLLGQRDEATLEERFRAVVSALSGDELATATDDHPRGLDGFVRLAVERLETTMGSEALVMELLVKCVVLGKDGTAIPAIVLGPDALREGAAIGVFDVDEGSVSSSARVHKLTRESLERLLVRNGSLTNEFAWMKLCEGLDLLVSADDGTVSGRRRREAPVFESLLDFLNTHSDMESELSEGSKGSLAKIFVGGSRSAVTASAFLTAQAYAERALKFLGMRGVVVEDTSVADCYHALGVVAYSMGRYEEAGEHHRRALAIQTKVYGTDEHADVAASYHALGNVARSMRRYEEEGEHYRKALEIRTRLYGTDKHPDVAGSYFTLGHVESSMGRYDEAIGYYRKALAIWRNVHGTNEHPHAASSYHSLGNMSCSKGRYKEAGKYYRLALKIATKLYGTNEHTDVASSYYALGDLAHSMGRYKEAGEHQQQALMIYTKVYGTDEHANVASSYHALGNVAYSMGNYKEADEHYRRALAIRTLVYGTDEHADVATSYHALGNLAMSLQMYEEAGKYYRLALAIETKVYGTDEHADEASSYYALGNVAYSLGRREEAGEHFRRALAIWTKVYGTDEHADVAASYHGLGVVAYSMGRYKEAGEHHWRALAIRTKVYGTDEHADVAASYHALGNVAYLMGRCEEAGEHYRRALAILTKVYGTDEHANVASIYKALGNVAYSMGKYEEAGEHHRRARAIKTKV